LADGRVLNLHLKSGDTRRQSIPLSAKLMMIELEFVDLGRGFPEVLWQGVEFGRENVQKRLRSDLTDRQFHCACQPFCGVGES
jgi:hypothetical protein